MHTQIAQTAVNTSGMDLIPGTTWTYADAADMASECRREDRLFGNRHAVPTVRRRRICRSALKRSPDFQAKFQDQTGWNWDDAVDEALAAQDDNRSLLRNILDRCDA